MIPWWVISTSLFSRWLLRRWNQPLSERPFLMAGLWEWNLWQLVSLSLLPQSLPVGWLSPGSSPIARQLFLRHDCNGRPVNSSLAPPAVARGGGWAKSNSRRPSALWSGVCVRPLCECPSLTAVRVPGEMRCRGHCSLLIGLPQAPRPIDGVYLGALACHTGLVR